MHSCCCILRHCMHPLATVVRAYHACRGADLLYGKISRCLSEVPEGALLALPLAWVTLAHEVECAGEAARASLLAMLGLSIGECLLGARPEVLGDEAAPGLLVWHCFGLFFFFFFFLFVLLFLFLFVLLFVPCCVTFTR